MERSFKEGLILGSALAIGAEGCTSISHLPKVDVSIKSETAGFVSHELSAEQSAQFAHNKRLEVHEALMSTLSDNRLFLPDDESEKIETECQKPINTCYKLAELIENRAKLDFFNYEDDCFTYDSKRFNTKCPEQLLRENHQAFIEAMNLQTFCDNKFKNCAETQAQVYRHEQAQKIDFNRFKPKEKLQFDY